MLNFKIRNRIALNGYITSISAVYFINDGDSYPAVGMSFGLVPICEILKTKNIDLCI